MTDLRHLGELLQARSEEIAGREELLSWFADECERPIPRRPKRRPTSASSASNRTRRACA